MSIYLLSLSHKTTPLEIRSWFAYDDTEKNHILEEKQMQLWRGGVGLGAVKAGHGPGVDLEDHVPLHQGLQRLQSGGAVLGAALVEAAAVLVELGDKIEMTYDVTVGFLGDLQRKSVV